MKRGPKPQPPSEKLARGTFQPVRDGLKTEIIVPGNPPAMPDYLSPEAIDVWQENIGRVMASGTTELDSDLFARYCATEALVRKAFKAGGEAPPAAYLTLLRQYAELLGIAGRRSRVGKVANDPTQNANPFKRVGAR
jgi:phage terminase small subunit